MRGNDYNHMSSDDMAKALLKYHGKLSEDCLKAIATRLVRNASILRGQEKEAERHQPALTEVRDAAYTYIKDPTDGNFVMLTRALQDEEADVMQCVRAKALHRAATLLADMQGCPPSNCPHAASLTTCDGGCRADCWYTYLKEGIKDV